jgi:hypothetical protein
MSNRYNPLRRARQRAVAELATKYRRPFCQIQHGYLHVALNHAFVLVQLREQELEIAPQQDHLFFSFEEFINEFFF